MRRKQLYDIDGQPYYPKVDPAETDALSDIINGADIESYTAESAVQSYSPNPKCAYFYVDIKKGDKIVVSKSTSDDASLAYTNSAGTVVYIASHLTDTYTWVATEDAVRIRVYETNEKADYTVTMTVERWSVKGNISEIEEALADVNEWAAEAGEVVDASSDDWEPSTAEQRFEQLQGEIAALNAVVNTKQLSAGAVETDVIPTENSGHVVTSGGVHSALHTLETQVNGQIASLDAAVSQAASAANGQLSLSVTEVDGKITAVSGSITEHTYDAYGSASAEALRAAGAEQQLQQDIAAKYTKPSGGIPKTDLDAAVQTSLGKADTALQNHQDISGKVDKVTGKGLSENDFTDSLKSKLDNIAAGAEVNVQSDWNQADTSADDYIKNKPTNVSAFTNDAGYLTQHQDISGKANSSDLAAVATSGSYNDLSNKPTIPTVPTNVSAFTNDSGYLTSHQSLAGYVEVGDLVESI